MKGYTISQLNDIELLTRILRASPQISWDEAKSLNGLNFKASELIKKYQDVANLLEERYKAANDDVLVIEEIKKEITKLNSEKHELIDAIKIEATSLTGDKEYNTQMGVKSFSYREAYFGLLNIGLIID